MQLWNCFYPRSIGWQWINVCVCQVVEVMPTTRLALCRPLATAKPSWRLHWLDSSCSTWNKVANTHTPAHSDWSEWSKTCSLLDCTSIGQSAEAASDLGLAYMHSRVSGLGGVVTVDPAGRWAARFSSQQMAWAAAQEDTLHWGLWTGEHFAQKISETSWQWHCQSLFSKAPLKVLQVTFVVKVFSHYFYHEPQPCTSRNQVY